MSVSAATTTLPQAYANGGAGPQTLTLDSTRLGIIVADNATPIGADLFSVTKGAVKMVEISDLSATGMILHSPNGNGLISSDDSLGTKTCYSNTCISVGSSLVNANILGTNGQGNIYTIQDSTTVHSTSGDTFLYVANGGGAGTRHYALVSGAQQILSDGEELSCSGTCTAGQVVVWTSARTVATAAATANLTTIAGVAVTTGTNAVVIVARHGRAFVNAESGVTSIGGLVGTSGTTAGRCNASSPGAGAILGRVVEAVGTTIANQAIIDLILG